MPVLFAKGAHCHISFGTKITKVAFSINAHLKSKPSSNASSNASLQLVLDSLPPKSLSKMLSHHWDTPFPTSSQLRRADQFFLSHEPSLLYSSTQFRTVRQSEVPEVAFLGRSNVGKSSLLNALMARKICHTGKSPGSTKTMNFFAVGGPDESGNQGRLVVLDLPGYGKGSKSAWGPEILKYLAGRRQYALHLSGRKGLTFHRLRRAFVLVDALHGLKPLDRKILELLRQHAVSHQIILSKVDRVLFPKSKNPSEAKIQKNSLQLQEMYEGLRTEIQPGKFDGPEGLGEIISCSGVKSLEKGKRVGIDQVRWAVLAATGLGDMKQKLVLDTTGLSSKKRKLSLSDIEDEDEDEFDFEQPAPGGTQDTKQSSLSRRVNSTDYQTVYQPLHLYQQPSEIQYTKPSSLSRRAPNGPQYTKPSSLSRRAPGGPQYTKQSSLPRRIASTDYRPLPGSRHMITQDIR